MINKFNKNLITPAFLTLEAFLFFFYKKDLNLTENKILLIGLVFLFLLSNIFLKKLRIKNEILTFSLAAFSIISNDFFFSMASFFLIFYNENIYDVIDFKLDFFILITCFLFNVSTKSNNTNFFFINYEEIYLVFIYLFAILFIIKAIYFFVKDDNQESFFKFIFLLYFSLKLNVFIINLPFESVVIFKNFIIIAVICIFLFFSFYRRFSGHLKNNDVYLICLVSLCLFSVFPENIKDEFSSIQFLGIVPIFYVYKLIKSNKYFFKKTDIKTQLIFFICCLLSLYPWKTKLTELISMDEYIIFCSFVFVMIFGGKKYLSTFEEN